MNSLLLYCIPLVNCCLHASIMFSCLYVNTFVHYLLHLLKRIYHRDVYIKSKGNKIKQLFLKKRHFITFLQCAFLYKTPQRQCVYTLFKQDKNTAIFTEVSFDHMPPINISLTICGFDWLLLPSLAFRSSKREK